MKRMISVIVSAFLLFSLLASFISFSAAKSETDPGPVTEEKAVRDLIDDFLSAYPFGTIDASAVKVTEQIPITRICKEDHNYLSVSVEDAAGSPAYFMIDLTDGIVTEFAEGTSPFSRFTDIDGEFLYEPLGYYLKTEEGKVFDLSAEDVFAAEIQRNENYAGKSKAQLTGQSTESSISVENIRTIPTYGFINNVPDYQQESGYLCINTSILNIISYWDTYGFPYLIDSSTQLIFVRATIESYLGLNGGSGYNSSIPGAVSAYAIAHGNYDSLIDNIWNPEFFDLQFEISEGYPCLVGFPYYYGSGHMTTGVGYFSMPVGIDYCTVHDNHSDTPENVIISFSEVDFISAITFFD